MESVHETSETLEYLDSMMLEVIAMRNCISQALSNFISHPTPATEKNPYTSEVRLLLVHAHLSVEKIKQFATKVQQSSESSTLSPFSSNILKTALAYASKPSNALTPVSPSPALQISGLDPDTHDVLKTSYDISAQIQKRATEARIWFSVFEKNFETKYGDDIAEEVITEGEDEASVEKPAKRQKIRHMTSLTDELDLSENFSSILEKQKVAITPGKLPVQGKTKPATAGGGTAGLFPSLKFKSHIIHPLVYSSPCHHVEENMNNLQHIVTESLKKRSYLSLKSMTAYESPKKSTNWWRTGEIRVQCGKSFIVRIVYSTQSAQSQLSPLQSPSAPAEKIVLTPATFNTPLLTLTGTSATTAVAPVPIDVVEVQVYTMEEKDRSKILSPDEPSLPSRHLVCRRMTESCQAALAYYKGHYYYKTFTLQAILSYISSFHDTYTEPCFVCTRVTYKGAPYLPPTIRTYQTCQPIHYACSLVAPSTSTLPVLYW